MVLMRINLQLFIQTDATKKKLKTEKMGGNDINLQQRVYFFKPLISTLWSVVQGFPNSVSMVLLLLIVL